MRLIQFDPEKDISQIGIRLRTPISLHNANEASMQTTQINDRNSKYQNSSPASIFGALYQIAEGTNEGYVQDSVNGSSGERELEEANATLSKRLED